LDPIGNKPVDVSRVLERLGKALAPRDSAASAANADVRQDAGAAPDLRTLLAAAFRGVDPTDERSLRRVRSTVIPLIVRHTIDDGGHIGDAAFAEAVQAVESMFDADPRLGSLLARAVEGFRGD
jgi:hypothetical protein